jgi:hypothetical protein
MPDLAWISTLNVAAMRGIRVDLLLAEKNNLRIVQWACTAALCRSWSEVGGSGPRPRLSTIASY